MTAWQTSTGRKGRAIAIALLIALFACFSVSTALAQTNYSTSTPAGTPIQNSASVTYQDASANSYSAQSTAVSTYVQQIDGFAISPVSYTLNGVANENVAIKYVITNYSNGSEKIQLTVNNIANVDIASGTSHLYQDNAGTPNAAGGDLTNQSITIAQNGSYTFWWVGTMSALQAHAGGQFTVEGVDQGAPSIPAGAVGNWTAPTLAANAVGTVTVNLTSGAVINLTKSMSPNSGTGGTLSTTLTYSNPGARNATDVWIVDYLPTTTFTYSRATANITWQGQSVQAGDAVMGTSATVSGQTIAAAYYDGTTGKQLNGQTTPALVFHITGVPFSASTNYTINFPITTAAGLLPGSYTNIAQFAYADAVNATPATTSNTVNPCNTGAANTNNCLTTSASYTLNQTYSATLTPATQTIAQGVSGQSVTFTETVTNTGNGNDTIQLSTAIGTFPVGTTFTYYANDGVTALTPVSGSNGSVSAVFASPVLAPAGTYIYKITATLPTGYTTSSAISFTPQATPKNGTGTVVTATDTLSKVIQAVDILSGLTSGAFGTPTSGAATSTDAGGLGATSSVTVASPGIDPVVPSNFYVYELWIENNQSITDSFNVVASNTTTFSTTDNLVSGMTVAYYNGTSGTCATLGSAISMPISNVPVFSGSNATLVCAKVTVAPGFSAGTQNVYFQAASATNTANKDNVHDTLTVNAYYHITVSSTTGSVNPGASVVYANTITNDGNQPITTISFASGFVTDAAGGTPSGGVFNSTLYTSNALSTAVTTSTQYSNLAVGGSVTVYAQVNAAIQDQVGQNDTTTITVTYTTGSGTTTAFGTDTTNVVSAINNVTVTKTQTLDPACSGLPANWSPATPSAAAVQAKPGDCVVYRIAVSNNTGSTVNNVYVSDQLNSYLTYCDGTAGTCGASVAAGTWFNVGASTFGSMPAPSGNIVTSPTLNQVTSGQSAPYFQFEVKIK